MTLWFIGSVNLGCERLYVVTATIHMKYIILFRRLWVDISDSFLYNIYLGGYLPALRLKSLSAVLALRRYGNETNTSCTQAQG